LGQTHNLVVNVSDARAVFALKGDGVRDVLAKITPVDLRPEVLPDGLMCRTRLGQVAGAFWLTDDTTLWVICFRSVAAYVYDVLTDAADKTAQIRYF
jgi:sarcosine oxidase subunit gamma